ncbi:MAG TPA: aldehyde dehydrogenase (NADP(+)) [Algoriphagus sp.]|jgi:NADP-dependent aldehyde dehydrogenase|uniref:aldehyde dehydrogenase (NADP(+)) n=1 Tax=unclassified Algoriphagus TaxID=2641541 RepID=UPI000C4434B5|nr:MULTISPECIES: aldehyde dehydrogenase (NADP(+)) [unclassified Algoriphagus]MAL12312.1 aldehyde dehydrogenase (NADP(+)) [Algoriphagus sp.]QYH40165.1 aldehyde dehydrogenase (NADP(+)) [Algoriphagus sp. NBT04N3]HAD53044.1 aldehyde dehydrogenase (NADP(+)) [Algoriphagus sp.]HAS59367.1 aldehyde dehydrogenase (NADP(+)) [Algoriphagus sp.]HCB46778.1 aldehyde dehydrogenase (NADP(+)) [Algoriphagus sp.]|tara:strand:- start:1551 stop:2996 length:1446 start_codon:yes stop_codon:yes gene_type:complete
MNLDQIFNSAQEAFLFYKNISGKEKAAFLDSIAETLEANREEIVPLAVEESNLPEGRINGELGRTVGQIRLFAGLVREGSWLEATVDPADPNRQPLPKADIRRMLSPLGPVVVFGASNFPLAFSTAGGDTISALAAGCPVIYKAHPAHPETSKKVADCIHQAILKSSLPSGIFSHVEGGIDIGQELVKHPLAKAVGFTGSHKGGKALFDLANQREEPIPVYAEMGSVNPIFCFKEKLANQLEPLAKAFVGSLTLGVGQFCTNPGLIFVPKAQAKAFEKAISDELNDIASAPMLHPGIAQAYYDSIQYLQSREELRWVKVADPQHLINGSTALAEIKASDWLKDTVFQKEVFGAFAMMVVYENQDELLEIAKHLHGQLTITIWAENHELQDQLFLLNLLEEKCGRLLFKGVPTGVEVGFAMQHGGPYPSTTDARGTSVGAYAIKRFARPIAFQDMPQELLPDALKDGNPLGIWRMVNGEYKK